LGGDVISTIPPTDDRPTSDARRQLREMYLAAGDTEALRRLEEVTVKEALWSASTVRRFAPYIGAVAGIGVALVFSHEPLTDIEHNFRVVRAASLPMVFGYAARVFFG
jgi:hypothetical protein